MIKLSVDVFRMMVYVANLTLEVDRQKFPESGWDREMLPKTLHALENYGKGKVYQGDLSDGMDEEAIACLSNFMTTEKALMYMHDERVLRMIGDLSHRSKITQKQREELMCLISDGRIRTAAEFADCILDILGLEVEKEK